MVLHLFCNQATAVRFCHGAPVKSLSSNGRTLIKGYPVKDTVSILKIPCQGRDPGSNPGCGAKLRMLTAKIYTFDF